MKIRIKETDEVLEDVKFIETTFNKITIKYLDDGVLRNYSIKNLSDIEEVKDYEEPKGKWFISNNGQIHNDEGHERFREERKQIGNYFDTREQAKKAIEKLKIYNKLKQKGFVFSGWYYSTEGQLVILADNHEFSETEPEDLTELFGGEE